MVTDRKTQSRMNSQPSSGRNRLWTAAEGDCGPQQVSDRVSVIGGDVQRNHDHAVAAGMDQITIPNGRPEPLTGLPVRRTRTKAQPGDTE